MTELRSILLGTSALSVALLMSFLMTVLRPALGVQAADRKRLLRLLLLGVAVQCFHVIEEFVTGFYIKFPQLLGLSPWTANFFVSFNLTWIAVWLVSAVCFCEGIDFALFPIWFFAIGMTMNGFAHPILALRVGGYFPGLVTSSVVGVVGCIVLLQLWAFTGPRIQTNHPSSPPGL